MLTNYSYAYLTEPPADHPAGLLFQKDQIKDAAFRENFYRGLQSLLSEGDV